MQVVLFDTLNRGSLYPFSEIRSVADIQCGIFSIRKKWEQLLNTTTYTLTTGYLQDKYRAHQNGDSLYIHSKIIPSNTILEKVLSLKTGNGVSLNGNVILVKTNQILDFGFAIEDCEDIHFEEIDFPVDFLEFPFQITQLNSSGLMFDFHLLTNSKTTKPISSSNKVDSPENIFIDEGAVVEHCYLNAMSGPIYIGKDCLIMEGAMIRGPFAMLEESVVKMGSKIYGATTIGKKCIIGGEIKNSVFFDYSNKAHDGYIGDAVIGEWCNVGAGASCSNIKNNAGEIKIWNRLLHQWINAGNKCGVMLGDYTKVAINSSLTTGMVSGICCNILTEGLSPKYIADFSWNIKTGEKYNFEKALRDIENWMDLKNKEVSDADQNILKYLYHQLT